MAADKPLPSRAPDLVEESVSFGARKSRVEEVEMDITPMIDITFLLLIFFLVASNQEKNPAVTLPPAKTGVAALAATSIILTIASGAEGAPPLIYKSEGKSAGALLNSSDPLEQEQEIAEYIENRSIDDASLEGIILMAEENVKEREVARVARAIGIAAAGKNLYVAVVGAK